MAREDAQMKLRLPDRLKNSVASAAEKNGRSMNAEIVARLERSMDIEDQYGDLESVISEIFNRLETVEGTVHELYEVSMGRDPYNQDK